MSVRWPRSRRSSRRSGRSHRADSGRLVGPRDGRRARSGVADRRAARRTWWPRCPARWRVPATRGRAASPSRAHRSCPNPNHSGPSSVGAATPGPGAVTGASGTQALRGGKRPPGSPPAAYLVDGGEAVLGQVEGDAGPAPAVDLEVALGGELVVRGLDGDPGDPELAGQGPRRGQAGAGSEPTVGDRVAQTPFDLAMERFDVPSGEGVELERAPGPHPWPYRHVHSWTLPPDQSCAEYDLDAVAVVASRSPGIGIVAAVGLALVVATACGQSGSATPTDDGAARVPGRRRPARRRLADEHASLARPTRARPTVTSPRSTLARVSSRPSMASPSRARWLPPGLRSGSPATVRHAWHGSTRRRTRIAGQVPLDGSPCGVAVGPGRSDLDRAAVDRQGRRGRSRRRPRSSRRSRGSARTCGT